MIKLDDIYDMDVAEFAIAVRTLYNLLGERDPVANISHKAMPTFAEHNNFIHAAPYEAWYLIKTEDECVGAIYISDNREVGIAIFKAHQHKGYGRKAIAMLREKHPGPLLANIAPGNDRSQRFFASLGFGLVQYTFKSNEQKAKASGGFDSAELGDPMNFSPVFSG